jgi:hypothetical protein
VNVIVVGGALLLLSLVYAFIAFVRQAAGGEYRSAVLQILVWGAGFGAVYLFAASQFGKLVSVNGLTFGAMSFSTKLLLGFLVASPASVLRDALTAVDNTTSVALPALFRPRAVVPPPAPAGRVRKAR